MPGLRRKTPKTVLTFASTADAMDMEAAAREHGLPGRIIPVPSDIDAGCGFAWRVEPEQRDALMREVACLGLPYEGEFQVDMY